MSIRLRSASAATPARAPGPLSPGIFTDRFGQQHQLIPIHRQAVRLPSQTGYDNRSSTPASDQQLVEHLRSVRRRVRLGQTLLQAFRGSIAGCRVLNVGALNGSESVVLAGLGAAAVLGTDYGSHYVERDAVADVTGLRRIEEQRRRIIAAFRRNYSDLGFDRRVLDTPIDFVLDDIANSGLPERSFEIICTWATLEHVQDPAGAFKAMYRLLVPGGLVYIEYHPFFALDGGHWPATLDFPWGHVRLDELDIARYLACYRPEEPEALDYYRTGLNRLTIEGARISGLEAGLEILALVPRARTEDLLLITEPLLAQARHQYPQLAVNDLVCRIVRMVLRRPGDEGPCRS